MFTAKHLGRVAAGLLPFLASVAGLSAQQMERVSVSTLGAQGDQKSERSEIARDGRYIAFQSKASTLVPGDLNFVDDIFVRDLSLGTTELITKSMTGGFGNGISERPGISADGRYVTFASDSSNLVPNDTNINRDVFLRDRLLGTTILISKSSAGVQGNGYSTRPSISSDGRFISFRSSSTNLIPLDANGALDDIFVHDTLTGITELVSQSSAGVQGNLSSDRGDISGDGNRIAFYSDASNLVPGDTNAVRDVFLRDRAAGTTIIVSVSSLGVIANAEASRPGISEDGKFVVYRSIADNLVPGDTNLAEDVFRYQVATGTTICVSLTSSGVAGNGDSSEPAINKDGSLVAFRSIADNLAPGDVNLNEDVFLRNVNTGVTTLISQSLAGVVGDAGSTNPSISGVGDLIAFESSASNLVANDTNLVQDVFLFTAAPPPSVDTIVLVGPTSAIPGDRLAYTWTNAAANSPWWFLYSYNVHGITYNGHVFDLGPPITVLSTGANNAAGAGAWTSPPLPGAVSGRTIYFEVAASAGGGQFADSNYITLVVQ